MNNFTLKKNTGNPNENPLLLIIMDGAGLYKGKSDGYPGNAFEQANTPTLDALMKDALFTPIMAHGTYVGMPSDDDMGNSEVGHNAMGAGRIFDQGAKLVSAAIESKKLFKDAAWQKLIGTKENKGLALQTKSNGENRAVHFIGLLSDGNVHSHIDHLLAMIDECSASGVKNLFIHILLDGRDVEEVSADRYIDKLELKLQEARVDGGNYSIASGGGRMVITMDRYEADWSMIELSWKTHVKAEGELYASASEAIQSLREKNPGVIDQNLPPFVIAKDGHALAPIQNDDIVIYFNFRGDRAIEISRAFTEDDFTVFKRDPEVKVNYAGMMQYDGDLNIPPTYLVNPPAIDRTLSQYLAENKIPQYAISETQKYGHVTYFWNGNNSEKFDEQTEEWLEIPSDNVSFDEAPRMKADQSTDALIKAMSKNKHSFYRINLANGDMVGHTGNLPATIEAMQAVDENVKRLLDQAKKIKATVIITADHGNCDQMIEVNKKTGEAKKKANGDWAAKTSHTLNPVPFIVCGEGVEKWKLNPVFNKENKAGLGNIAASILNLMGYIAPDDYLPSIIVEKI